jgi:hypothetical protein
VLNSKGVFFAGDATIQANAQRCLEEELKEWEKTTVVG